MDDPVKKSSFLKKLMNQLLHHSPKVEKEDHRKSKNPLESLGLLDRLEDMISESVVNKSADTKAQSNSPSKSDFKPTQHDSKNHAKNQSQNRTRLTIGSGPSVKTSKKAKEIEALFNRAKERANQKGRGSRITMKSNSNGPLTLRDSEVMKSIIKNAVGDQLGNTGLASLAGQSSAAFNLSSSSSGAIAGNSFKTRIVKDGEVQEFETIIKKDSRIRKSLTASPILREKPKK